VWTIDDRAEIDELLDLGVDGIMTDSLGTLVTALNDRGQWS
jgi:glycerophosphoryl diester phosphodiesterase